MFEVSGQAIQFGTVALITGAAAFFAVRVWGIGEHVETRPAGVIAEKDLSSLWFSSSGQAIGLRRNGLKAQIWSWTLDGGGGGGAKLQDQRSIDLAAPNAAAAISPDASWIAWEAPGSPRLDSLFGESPKAAPLPLARPGALAGLAFADNNRLALLYRDGRLETRDVESRQVLAAEQTAVKQPGPLFSSDRKLAVFSPSTGDSYTFDAGAADHLSMVEYKRWPPPLLALTLSRSGRVAVLTERGVLRDDVLCIAPGTVKAFAFDEDGRLLAVGDFEGIVTLTPRESAKPFAPAPPGAAAIAAAGGHVIFSGPGGTTLLAVQSVSGINSIGIAIPSVWALFVLFGLIRLVAGARAAARDAHVPEEDAPESPLPVQPRLQLVRSSPEAVAGALPAPVPPEGLLAQCRSRRCVLFAGSGLGAQAGVPPWKKLLQLLAYWAMEQDVATPAVRTAWVNALDRGRSASVADQMATAFAGREQVLQAGLRNSLQSKKSSSAAHEALKGLGIGGVITTSLDKNLDSAFPSLVSSTYTVFDAAALDAADPARDSFLLRLCGSLDRPDTILFGPAQYASAMAKSPWCVAFLKRTFTSRCLLFIGMSLETIEDSLSAVVLDGPPEGRHYALVNVQGQNWKPRAELLEQRYGIVVIPYFPSDTNYPDLPAFLESLCAQVGTQVGSIVDRDSQAPPPPVVLDPAAPRMQQCPTCGLCYDRDVAVCPADQSATEPGLPVERVLESRYQLDRLLGRGGMGAVFEATDQRLHRRVAVKVVLSDVFRHANALERFDREAKASAKLNHPNIISIYDYGVIGSRGAYMVMEMLDGVIMRHEMERLKRIPPATVADWADQLLDGVYAAHIAGIVHRDLKPENVFLAYMPKGAFHVKILDFGLAKVKLLTMAGGERLTVPDAALGTFGYMPPEQLAGGRADESSDLYSAGIMLIEALTGLEPFEISSQKDSLDTRLRDLFGALADRRDIDRLSEVLGRSVAPSPRMRYHSAPEFQQDLIAVLRHFSRAGS